MHDQGADCFIKSELVQIQQLFVFFLYFLIGSLKVVYRNSPSIFYLWKIVIKIVHEKLDAIIKVNLTLRWDKKLLY